MDDKPRQAPTKHVDPLQQRQDLHGRRRRLHERLSEVCEDFVEDNLTKEHKQKALIRELRYLLDLYQDPASWEGIE